MKLLRYIKDKQYAIILFFFFFSLFLLLFLAFQIELQVTIAILLLYTIFFLLLGLIDYLRKRDFYRTLFFQMEQLDQGFLICEMIEEPQFYEGKLLYQILYDANKSMIEHIKQYKWNTNDFKDYIEMWIHEVKIPIASLILMNHNHKGILEHRILEQIHKLEYYVDQILYYVRSEHANQDYLINQVSLKKIISSVALKNKDDFLENHIDFIVNVFDDSVLTDSKWLEFILNQILNNSIKYKDDHKKSYIQIKSIQDEKKLVLVVEDNGIGIPASDLRKVFEKSFTGHNGRLGAKSTGMGLFIAKKLCQKLGHKIEIESIQGEYTKVSITFLKNKYYEVLK